MPIRAIQQQLINEKGINAKPHEYGLACTYAWTAIKHKRGECQNDACEWCLRTPAREPSASSSPLLHHVWFTTLITRIIPIGAAKFPEAHMGWREIPRWAPPLIVYNTAPSEDGDPLTTWPLPAGYRYNRVLTTLPNGHEYRQHTQREDPTT